MLFFASFTEAGVPKTGLSPTISIWEDDGSQVVTDQAMTEIAGGHYLYDYAGYDDTKDYVATADGGATLGNADRYKLGTNAVQAGVDALENLSQTDVRTAMTAQGYTTALAALLATVSTDTVLTRKYAENRLEWDFTTTPVTITLYDDDATTPLKTHEMATDADGRPVLIPTVQSKRSASTI